MGTETVACQPFRQRASKALFASFSIYQVVQEALAGERTLAQIAAQHGVHPKLITKWKRAALQAMPSAFAENVPLEAQIAALKAEHEREKEQLYAEIGRLTTQVHWLPKKIAAGGASSSPAYPGRTHER